MQDSRRQYRALAARDPRFDGVFFVGVTSTGIYCRPICPARTPKASHCRFFATAPAAESAGFRPCLRCRPELAPGLAPVDDGSRIAEQIAQRLDEGEFDERTGIEALAAQFEISARQMRRIVRQQLGVSPMQMLLTRRLLLAKQLLTDTTVPITDVAFASGFASVRRFNDAFRTRYGMPPSRLRRQPVERRLPLGDGSTSTLLLTYRPPYDWPGILEFLAARAVGGVEAIADGSYARTVQIGRARGWIRVGHAKRENALSLELSQTLMPVLPALIARVRALFDLDARPDVIARHLRSDARLRAAVRANPGLRVPGAFDGFELAVRAILGQQVSVKAATTLACRFAGAFGEATATPVPGLDRFTPAASRVAAAGADAVARLGIVRARAASIVALAEACEAGTFRVGDGAGTAPPDALIRQMTALPGIGAWTAQYVAMRALRWPDAFPKEDLVLRRRLGGATARDAEALSQAWRPWRSYAVMHLWRMPRAE